MFKGLGRTTRSGKGRTGESEDGRSFISGPFPHGPFPLLRWILCALLAAPGGLAQTVAPDPAKTIKVSVDLVLVNVTVLGPGQLPIAHLQQSDFALYRDGVPQPIAYFEAEGTPPGVVLLMDVSSSMEGAPIGEARRAAREFIKQSHAQGEIAVIAFNDQVRTIEDFTLDRSRLLRAIEGLTASGGTALYDALAEGAHLMRNTRYAKRVIVLLSDGKDEDSRQSFGAVEKLVQSGNLAVFAVGEYTDEERKLFAADDKYFKPPDLEINLNPKWVLRRLATLTGGDAFFPHQREPLTELFAQIARRLQHQYLLGFVPLAGAGDSVFHKIDVRVKSGSHAGPLTVKARQGYLDAAGATDRP